MGREVGVSGWVQIDQDRIDRFAEVTEDTQFIHVDPTAARQTIFGGTVAHGFLVLSMLSKFAYEVGLEIPGTQMAVNYGFERVRYPSPVPAGARIRGRLGLKSMDMRSPTRAQLVYEVVVEIEGKDKPAAVAEWVTLHELAPTDNPVRG